MKRNGFGESFVLSWQRQHHNHKKYQNFSHKIFINNYKLSFFCLPFVFFFFFCLTVYLPKRKFSQNYLWHHSTQSNRMRFSFFLLSQQQQIAWHSFYNIERLQSENTYRSNQEKKESFYSEKFARTNLKFDPCMMKDKFKLSSTSENFFLFSETNSRLLFGCDDNTLCCCAPYNKNFHPGCWYVYLKSVLRISKNMRGFERILRWWEKKFSSIQWKFIL